jgi:hypothetical protein
MNTLHALPISVVLLLLSTVLAFAESHPKGQLPSIVQRAIDESRADCEEPIRLKSGFIVEKDINGDGRKDYILDYKNFLCGGKQDLCGSAGCAMQVFVSLDGTYVEVLDRTVQKLRFVRVKGRPAMLVHFRGTACERGYWDDCIVTLIWNGRTFKCPHPATAECRAL